MTPADDGVHPRTPRLYRELTEWYPLLTPVSDYQEEAACYLRAPAPGSPSARP